MLICMGAPNYFRGGSHCGNLSCHEAMAEDLVDILCSDYHFPSLLACALRMMEGGMTPSAAMKMLTLHPAQHLGFEKELGSIEVGKRADLVCFQPQNGQAQVTGVWVDGARELTVESYRRRTREALCRKEQEESQERERELPLQSSR